VKIIGVMIRACDQARFTGPFFDTSRWRKDDSPQLIVASGSAATKMIAKYTQNSVRGGFAVRSKGASEV
jgi:hypothetical protein